MAGQIGAARGEIYLTSRFEIAIVSGTYDLIPLALRQATDLSSISNY
jgi:hypothetical protein